MELERLWSEWKVEKYIGEGSFGKVYKIVREEFGHKYTAALKVIEIPQNKSEYKTIKSEGLSDASAAEYFKSVVEDIVNEFALMSQLKGNSNIVSYEDHSVVPKDGEFGWTIYIRMELLTPLFDYMENRELTVKNVIQLGIDICKALEVCQKYSIIHRDIKPENIFVSDIGTFKLGDFGIARQLEKTTSGMSKKGTYTYMAPEVYKGLEYNSTVDIYSLGIVLYRFLNNNRMPFMPPAPQQIRYSDKEQANIMRLGGEKMKNPANADGRLAEIVLKACAYNPKERYEDPSIMRNELEVLLYADSEEKFTYANGDILSSEKNEYITPVDKKINNLFYDTQDDREKTSFLFRSIEDEQKKQQEEEALRRKQEEERKKQGEEQLRKEERLKQQEKLREEERLREKEESEKEREEKNKGIRLNKLIPFVIGSLAILLTIFALVFSRYGEKKIEVPDTTGQTFEKAVETLQGMGFKVEESYETALEVEEGIVLSQEEEPGSELKKGSTIHITVCSGTLVQVPNVIGQTLEDAEHIIEDLNLVVSIEEEYSNDIESGIVISQNSENEELQVGETVYLIVSKGEAPVEVPDITGESSKSAKQQLKEIGLNVKITKKYSSKVKKGVVISQSVDPGVEVEKGTTIKLIVSKGEEPTETTSASTGSSESTSKSTTSGSSSTKSNSSTKNTTKATTEATTQATTEATTAYSGSDDSLEDWDTIN